MEKVKVCYMNFDFDNQLSLETYNSSKSIINPESKINKALRYLLFWVCREDEALLSFEKNYKDKYTKIIRELRYLTPLSSDALNNKICFWWGDISTKEKWLAEKRVNSKFNSHLVEKELGIYCTGEIKEFESSDLSLNVIVKKEHGFTGRGVVNNSNYKGRVLIETVLDRVNDYGTIVSDNSTVIFQNFVSRAGQYIGSYFSDGHNKQHSEAIKIHNDIFNHYKKNHKVSSLQIDSFTYRDNGQLKWRYLCEVNHRKSIGQVASLLHDEFGNKESLFVIVPSSIDKKTLPNSNFSKVNQSGVLRLSHVSEEIHSYFLTAETKEELYGFWIESRLNLAVTVIDFEC